MTPTAFLPALTILLMVAAVEARADTCEDALYGFALKHGLSVPSAASPPLTPKPSAPAGPTANGSAGPGLSEKLAESGGVIRPPPHSDTGVLTPPPVADPMPTFPRVAPESPQTPPDVLASERKAQIQSLIDAAFADAQAGREAACFESLSRAEQLADASTKNP